MLSDYYMLRFGAPVALEVLRGLGYDTLFVVVSGKIGEDAVVRCCGPGRRTTSPKGTWHGCARRFERELEVESAPGSGTRVRFEVTVSRLLEE